MNKKSLQEQIIIFSLFMFFGISNIYCIDVEYIVKDKWASSTRGLIEDVVIDNINDCVYVAKTFEIQKFDLNGNFLVKWGGKGSNKGQFNLLEGIDVDSQGNVFVVDNDNNRIQKFDSSGNFILEWGAKGSIDGYFDYPSDLAIDSLDNVYVIDVNNDKVQKFDSNGNFVLSWSENFKEGNDYCITVDPLDSIYLTQDNTNPISKYNSSGVLISQYHHYTIGTTEHRFSLVRDIAINGTYIYLTTDISNNSVVKLDMNFNYITHWGSLGVGDGEFRFMEGISLYGDDYVYVADIINNRIQKFSASGAFDKKWNSYGIKEDDLGAPFSMVVDKSGNLHILDFETKKIKKFSSKGDYISQFGGLGDSNNEFKFPVYLSIDNDGNIFVCDIDSACVKKFDSNNNFIKEWGSLGTQDGEFFFLCGLAFDNFKNIYVIDMETDRVQKFSNDGVFISKFETTETGDIKNSRNVYLDIDSNNNIYIADENNYCIKKYDSNGNFIKKWGSKGSGQTQFDAFRKIVIDDSDNILVVDNSKDGNNTVTKIQKFNADGEFLGNIKVKGTTDKVIEGADTIAIDGSFMYATHEDLVIYKLVLCPAVMSVNKEKLDFGDLQEGEKTLSFVISNTGGNTLNGTISTNRDWIVLSVAEFNANKQEVEVKVSREKFKEDGNYAGMIFVNSNVGKACITVSVVANCVLTKPNPYNPKVDGSLKFYGSGVVPFDTTIQIFTVSGEHVKTLHENIGLNEIAWDGKNEQGKEVVSGIYIYTSKSPKEKWVGKFTVIRK